MIVLLAISSVLGVAAYFYWPFIFVIICYFLYLFFLKFHPKKTSILSFLTILLFFSISALHDYFHQSRLLGSESELILRFHDVYEMNGASFQSFVQTEHGEQLLLRYYIQSQEEKEHLRAIYKVGLICKVSGELEQPTGNRNENAFNYHDYLQTIDVHWIYTAKSSPFQACQYDTPTFIERVKSIRLAGLFYIENQFPEEAKAFAAALLFGESSWIGEETYDAYKKLSLIHILAISGLHVTIISGGLFYAGIRLGLTRETTKIIIIVLLPIYCLLAGGAPSIMRASFMVMTLLLLSLWRVKVSPVELLCSILMLLLIVKPMYLLQIGFQLSFFITFSLTMSVPILQRFNNKSTIVQSLVVTVICQLSSMALIVTNFYEFSLWGFLLNVLYIPLYTIILLPLTFVAFFLSLLSLPFAQIILKIIDFIFVSVNKLAVIIAEIPFVSLVFGKPSFILSVSVTLCIIGIFLYWEQQRKKPLLKMSLALVIVLTLFYHQESLSPVGEVVFIDVGQGDSVLIKRPFGNGVYLIDTGGKMLFAQEEWQQRRKEYDPGEDTVVPYLNSKGIRKIDKLILTHDDTDHIGGGLAILEHLDVREIVIAEKLKQEFLETALIQEAIERKIPITLVRAGDGWSNGNDTFLFLHPDDEDMGNSNENSLVMLMELNNLTWLLTGDIGIESEKRLLQKYPKLKVDVLKAGHHGSRHSSSSVFLDVIQPIVAIISAGPNNRYGHPHKEVIEVFNERQIQIFRTDEQGAIMYRYFLGKGTFSTVLP